MDTGIKRTQRDYTMAFKLAVVEQVEKGEMTYKQAQARYGIQGRTSVAENANARCCASGVHGRVTGTSSIVLKCQHISGRVR